MRMIVTASIDIDIPPEQTELAMQAVEEEFRTFIVEDLATTIEDGGIKVFKLALDDDTVQVEA